jgi:hypothetical protein
MLFKLKVSTNYVSGNPNSATWTNLSPALSSGAWAWVNSGELSLSAYISQTFTSLLNILVQQVMAARGK